MLVYVCAHILLFTGLMYTSLWQNSDNVVHLRVHVFFLFFFLCPKS